MFVDHDVYLESFEIACQLHAETTSHEFVIEEALKEQERMDQSEEIDARAALLFDPNTEYGERFEAVMSDILTGRHVSQTDPEEPGLYRGPVDNESDEEPTEDY